LIHALVQLGEAQPARALGEDTLQRCRRVYGPDHSVTLTAAAALTSPLVQVGDAEPARALGEDTLERCRRIFGPDHPITVKLTEAQIAGCPMPSSDAADGQPRRSLTHVVGTDLSHDACRGNFKFPTAND
jgi:hypothetical protein